MIIIRVLICMVAALILSANDFAWPADCTDLFAVIETEIDQDGNTYHAIFVNKIDGTDMECYRFGRCIKKLLESSSGMAAVEIINFDSYWVPSKWQWIDSTRAAVLAEEIDLEEYAWLSSYVWEVDHDD